MREIVRRNKKMFRTVFVLGFLVVSLHCFNIYESTVDGVKDFIVNNGTCVDVVWSFQKQVGKLDRLVNTWISSPPNVRDSEPWVMFYSCWVERKSLTTITDALGNLNRCIAFLLL